MAVRTENCVWQALMDDAYDRWQRINAENPNNPWTFEDMLDNCSELERHAVALGKLNQQVENGGFIQWVDNGYGPDTIDTLCDILPKMGPVSRKVLDMCVKFGDWDETELDEGDYELERWNEIDDRCSRNFYDLQDEWHEEVYTFLEA